MNGLRRGLSSLLAAAALAMPALGQARGFTVRPGTGIAARSGRGRTYGTGAEPRRQRQGDQLVMASAARKRARRNALRLKHWTGARDGC